MELNVEECWKEFINDQDESKYYHNFLTNEFSILEKPKFSKKMEKKIEKFFRLNPVNINYLKICQNNIKEDYLNKKSLEIVNNEFTKETFKIFMFEIRQEFDKEFGEETFEDEKLKYSKYRQEANEYIKNWFKLKMIRKIYLQDLK
jgi:hypothetical protein